MKVSELRQVLDRHNIDHSSCLEKSELVQMVKNIEVKQHHPDSEKAQGVPYLSLSDLLAPKEDENIDEKELCVICLDSRISTVFLECGHMACCGDCSLQVVSCPLCRRPISRVINVYHANK
jgi:hypothetical protein